MFATANIASRGRLPGARSPGILSSGRNSGRIRGDPTGARSGRALSRCGSSPPRRKIAAGTIRFHLRGEFRPGEPRHRTPEGDRVSDSTPRDTLKQTLTGPHSISLTGWLTTFLPASLLVAVQEASTPFPTFAFVLLSAVLQHLGDGVLAALALTVQRIAPRIDRIAIRTILWTAIGVSRGLVSGSLAVALAGIEPDYGYRVMFWVLVTWTWMPTIGYTIAQLETRRELLGIRDAERVALAKVIAKNAEHRQTLRTSLLDAVQASVGPAVDEIRVRLLRIGTLIDATKSREIGEKIAAIVDDAAAIVRGVPAAGAVGADPPAPRASVWAAIEFDQRRPLWSAAIMAIGMSTLLLPDTVRVAGISGASSVGLGILASVASVLLTALLERAIRPRSPAAHIAALAFRVLAAGVAGSTTILVIGAHDHVRVLLAAVLLPIVAGLASAIVPTVVGTRQANNAVRREIDELRAEREHSESEALVDEARVRAQVAELVHGPIQGRLSACAMALGFHAATEPPPDTARATFITTAVLDQLSAVSKDLGALADLPSGGSSKEAPN